jgi:predicted DNA-binding protein (UPF0251 family)
MSQIITLAQRRPVRMSEKLRTAIRFHVTEDMSIVAASKEAGMSRQGFHKALKRPEVRDYLRSVRQDYIETADAKKGFLKAKALEVAFDLMMNSKSEAIRARMVEFFAADAKVSPVAVHIDARQQPGGYVYQRPETLTGGH